MFDLKALAITFWIDASHIILYRCKDEEKRKDNLPKYYDINTVK